MSYTSQYIIRNISSSCCKRRARTHTHTHTLRQIPIIMQKFLLFRRFAQIQYTRPIHTLSYAISTSPIDLYLVFQKKKKKTKIAPISESCRHKAKYKIVHLSSWEAFALAISSTACSCNTDKDIFSASQRHKYTKRNILLHPYMKQHIKQHLFPISVMYRDIVTC